MAGTVCPCWGTYTIALVELALYLPALLVQKSRHLRPSMLRLHRFLVHIPTVSLGVTCVVVYTYGCDDGRISPTRCAIIAAELDGRCRPRQACRIPLAAMRSARNVLAAGLRPVSPAAPGGFPRSRTTPPSGIRSCGDASLARSAPGTRPCPPRLCLFGS